MFVCLCPVPSPAQSRVSWAFLAWSKRKGWSGLLLLARMTYLILCFLQKLTFPNKHTSPIFLGVFLSFRKLELCFGVWRIDWSCDHPPRSSLLNCCDEVIGLECCTTILLDFLCAYLWVAFVLTNCFMNNPLLFIHHQVMQNTAWSKLIHTNWAIIVHHWITVKIYNRQIYLKSIYFIIIYKNKW